MPIDHRIHTEVDTPTATSWNISEFKKTEQFLQEEKVDLLLLGKTLLDDPHWPYHAAQALGRETPQQLLPEQYAWWLKRQPKRTSEAD